MFEKDKHHGNHLAGIIASQGKGYGFEGIARHTELRSYNMFPTAEEMRQPEYQPLPDYIQAHAFAKPVRIFLMAHSKRAEQHTDYLPNKKYRYHMDKLGKVISGRGRTRPIVIAAAGDTPGGGINIDARTNMFPQVLGDAGNVIVVTACVDCERGKATLLRDANHSADEEETSKFVHVAAPGGTPVPGWTGPNSMGAVPGTSQAAAFAAGIAANMLNNYPNAYRDLGVLKLRMQACSWPLPYFLNGELNEDASKLAAGVLDPAICALDPNVAWIKQAGRGWSSAPLKRWVDPQGGAFADDSGGTTGPRLSHVLRIMKTDSSGEATWTIYSFVQKPGKMDRGYGQIKKDVAAKIDEKAMIEFCDGSKVALSELTDILPPVVVSECQSPSDVNAGSIQPRSPG
jgi:subtilisin family serine protease